MMSPIQSLITPGLARLHAMFSDEREELCFVGGGVRDALLGKKPKDIDLSTSADPQRQIEIYSKNKVRFYPTGIDHGTITVSVDAETYEITSYREDVATDGRRAVVKFTRDRDVDLGRRDLTINALAADFDGTIFDPFGGQADLESGRVRFVGNAMERIAEDHLRILRFIRFHFRFAHGQPIDGDAREAIGILGFKLADISRERVWSEVSKFIAGPGGGEAMREMMALNIAYPSGLPHGSWREVKRVHVGTRNPVTLMCAFLGDANRLEKQAERWRWSSAERTLAAFLTGHMANEEADYRRLLADDEHPIAWIKELSCLHERAHEGRALEAWAVPQFPVRGQDLLAAGHSPGKAIGDLLASLRTYWADHSYEPTKDQLLGMAKP